MVENSLNVTNMQKCGGIFIVACIFVCLTFNSTLPLSRDLSKATHEAYHNNLSQRCDLIERTKKMASNLENTLRRIKDSTQDFGKSIYDQLNTGIKNMANKDAITEDEIRHYEELVIMKKYPYLDLKALEMKYSPLPAKNTRQSAILAMDRLQNEPGVHCDTAEDLLNVEITNRGLSGFAIPPHLAKQAESSDKKIIDNVERKLNEDAHPKVPVPLDLDPNVLKSLKDDINTYIERKVAK
ncbi:uncharacterized protein LOC123869083 [Maniola jurtina]|uniref:uncharacterized protein LOC123869083 n=1 Tax=Maniola jurtina TaxID=191418 RepID=UPI001E68F8E9|nr:uncharacterized protein LOC123869083 [Maniola jurtina]